MIPDIHPIGIPDIDYDLALAVKWMGNGSPAMGAGHIIRATYWLLMELDDERAKKMIEFIDEYWFSDSMVRSGKI